MRTAKMKTNVLIRFSSIILICIMLLVFAGVTPAAANGVTVKWVDQAGGDDGNDGNTEATAYASLQHAIDNSSSGTDAARSIIYVKNGTYGVTGQVNTDGYNTAILIEDLDYLTIQAAPGYNPVVAPVTGVEAYIVSISVQNSHHLIIDNIDSDQTIAQFDNWHVFNSDDLTLRNSRFEGGEDGIDFNTDLTEALIENNVFTNITTGNGDEVLDFTDANYSNVIIQDNYFKYNYRQVTLNDAGGTVTGFIIQRNIMDGTNSEEAIRLIGASNVIIENNIIMNNMQQGVYIDSGCNDISILNNTFYNNDQESGPNGEIRTKVTSADIVIKNNIIYGNGTNPAFETSAGSLPGENYNLVYNTTDIGSFTFGANSITGIEPEFYSTTPGSEDLHIWYWSPAVNAGDDAAVISGATDYDGDPRIYDTVEIGADEYIPPSDAWVDDDWTVLNPGDAADGHTYGYNAFDNIQEAVNVVSGSTISVAAGTYMEAVTINPGVDLALQGEGRDVTTWIAPADSPSRMHCIKSELSSYAGTTTLDISGFTFSVEDNAISTGGIAININHAQDGPLYLNIHDNAFIETTTLPDETANSMLLCHNRFAARASSRAPVNIYNNLDYTGGGIAMSNTRAFDIYNNTFDGGSDALYIGYGCPTNTTIGDHHIFNNTFKNASNAYPDGPWPSVFFSYYGSGTGMTFLPIVIEDNTFEDNDAGIGYSMESDITYPADVIRHNDFINNGEAVIVSGTYATEVNAENNWWGADSGPAHASNPGGTGDVVSDDVDYDPWIGDPDSTDFEYINDGNDGTLTVDGSEVYIDMNDGQSGSFGAEVQTGQSPHGFMGMGNSTGLGKTIVITTDAANGTFIALVQFSYTDAELAAAGIDEDNLRLYYWDTVNLVWKLAVDGNIGGTPQWLGDSAPPTLPLGPGDIGKHGVDKANNIVWAVVDHNTDYSAGIGPVEAWVDDNYTPATVDWHINRFDSIQDAIDTCAATAIIHVDDGIYTEDIIVNKADMTIESVNGVATTIIQLVDGVGIDIRSTGGGFTLGGSAGHGLTVQSGGATTFNIQLTNAPSGVGISYNTIDTTGSASQGISVGAPGATGLVVNNNSFIAETGDGSIWGPKVVNVTVSGNTFTGPGGFAAGYAVEFAGVTGTSSINNNTITGYGMGIAIFNGEGTSGLSILDNDISDCSNGIRLGQYSPSATNGDMTTVTVRGNTLSTNTIGMRINDGANVLASNFVVMYNYFNGNNTDFGLKNEHTTEVVTASFNWWGDNLGPKHPSNPIGLDYGNGDTVSDMVIFQPWLDNGQQPSGDFYIDALADANTEVIITGAGGGHIVGAGRWSQHPDSAYPTFMVVGGYFIDVFVEDDTGFSADTRIEIRFHYADEDINAGLEENTLRMKWWDETANVWKDCSNTGVNTADNYVWVRVSNSTSPDLTELTGTPFSATGQRVIIPGLSTWGVMALAVLFLAGIVWAARKKKLATREA